MGGEQSRALRAAERRASNDSSNFTPKYSIGSQVGKGSFGAVHTVIDKSNPKATAVVKISVKKGSEAEYWSSISVFQREAEILQSLRHDNIVRFVDAIDDVSMMYLVTEACTGGQIFEQLCALDRFQETDAAAVMKQMLLAVDYIHGKRVMHRDIKAENFMFAEPPSEKNRGVVKMIDFGMSVKFEEGQVFNVRCGSRFYMAPEMMDRQYDYRIDMWAIGVLTYLLCCGEYPYRITGKKKYPNLSEPLVWPEDIPLLMQTKNFITKVLEHDPDKRMTSQGALAHQFASSADRRPSTSSTNSDLRKAVKQACKVISDTNHHTASADSKWSKLPIAAAKEVSRQATQLVGRARGNQVVGLEAKAVGVSADDMADTSTNFMSQTSGGLNASVEEKPLLSLPHSIDVMDDECDGQRTPRGHSPCLEMLGEDTSKKLKDWQQHLSPRTYPSDPSPASDAENADRPQELFQNKYKTLAQGNLQEQVQSPTSSVADHSWILARTSQMPSLPTPGSTEPKNSGRPGELPNSYKVSEQEIQQEKLSTPLKTLKSNDSARIHGLSQSRLSQQKKKTAGKKTPMADQAPLLVLPGQPA